MTCGPSAIVAEIASLREDLEVMCQRDAAPVARSVRQLLDYLSYENHCDDVDGVEPGGIEP